MYELDHLATFSVGGRNGSGVNCNIPFPSFTNLSHVTVCAGPTQPEDGMRKLRQMELQAGVWTMRVQMMIDRLDIVIIDRQTSVQYSDPTPKNTQSLKVRAPVLISLSQDDMIVLIRENFAARSLLFIFLLFC